MTDVRVDSAYDIATPEGVELKLPLAGFAPRSLAWMLDALVKSVALSILGVAVQFAGNVGEAVMFIGAFLFLWFYNVLFEVLYHGATPGKKALGIRVMNVNGTPVGWSGSVLRNLVRFVDTLPGVYLFGLISILLTERLQRLGDLAADTVVVFQPPRAKSDSLAGLEAAAFNVPLSPEEQAALVDFSERAPTLNSERAAELAAIVEPVFGHAGVDRLRAYAAWIVGRDRAA